MISPDWRGGPAPPVGLSAKGREEARELGVQLAGLPLDVCLLTRFLRTRETAELALEGRGVALHEEPLLDDIRVGELDGKTIEELRAETAANTGENIRIARFARFAVGEDG